MTQNEMPSHTHVVNASSAPGNDVGSSLSPLVLAGPLNDTYRPPTGLTAMYPPTSGAAGASQPHANQQPGLALSFCIALQGIFPSRN